MTGEVSGLPLPQRRSGQRGVFLSSLPKEGGRKNERERVRVQHFLHVRLTCTRVCTVQLVCIPYVDALYSLLYVGRPVVFSKTEGIPRTKQIYRWKSRLDLLTSRQVRTYSNETFIPPPPTDFSYSIYNPHTRQRAETFFQ